MQQLTAAGRLALCERWGLLEEVATRLVHTW
jgi:hypothetical protein